MSLKNVNTFTWKIVGESGFGISTLGILFSKIASRSGFYVFGYSEYPSLIRGGHQTSQVSVDLGPVYGARRSVDILLGLNRDSLARHVGELSRGAAVLFDSSQYTLHSAKSQIGLKVKDMIMFLVPFTELAVENAGLNIMSNMIALGSSLQLLGFGLEVAEDLIGEMYPDTREQNISALRAGYSYIQEHYEVLSQTFAYKRSGQAPLLSKPYVMTGIEALGLGAIAGGLIFYLGYPTTPSSTLMSFMAEHQYDNGYVVRQAEDEISVINMAIGASFAGARVLVATSGGGVALMSESLGFAAISEISITVINCQRPGPGTGLPTWTDQGDLRSVLHVAHGEFLRVVIASGDLEKCYVGIVNSLNLAEEFQIPVFVLSDKYLSEFHSLLETMPDACSISRGKLVITSEGLEVAVGQEYLRYETTNDGVGVRTILGVMGGIFLANSNRHDERGFSSEESDVRVEQVDGQPCVTFNQVNTYEWFKEMVYVLESPLEKITSAIEMVHEQEGMPLGVIYQSRESEDYVSQLTHITPSSLVENVSSRDVSHIAKRFQ